MKLKLFTTFYGTSFQIPLMPDFWKNHLNIFWCLSLLQEPSNWYMGQIYQLIPQIYHVSRRPFSEVRAAMALVLVVHASCPSKLLHETCDNDPNGNLSGYFFKPPSVNSWRNISLKHRTIFNTLPPKLPKAIPFGINRSTDCQEICYNAQREVFCLFNTSWRNNTCRFEGHKQWQGEWRRVQC